MTYTCPHCGRNDFKKLFGLTNHINKCPRKSKTSKPNKPTKKTTPITPRIPQHLKHHTYNLNPTTITITAQEFLDRNVGKPAIDTIEQAIHTMEQTKIGSSILIGANQWDRIT